ncbi:MAG TPA: hypothetical protein VFR23_00265 [Jiangellaceae bacterium]|nr:hypothetical protein [Jiangellaceae bacterium]
MLTNLIELLVAIGGAGMVALAVKQARQKGWSGSLQMAAGGFLLIGAAAIGIVGFLAGLVLDPLAWLGVVALGIAGVLFVTGQRLESRSAGRAVNGGDAAEPKPKAVRGKQQKAVESKKAQPAIDDDMAEIEEILRRHGIQ